MPTIGHLAAPLHTDYGDGIWNEAATSTQYRVCARDHANQLTYCDNATTIPDCVTQTTGTAQGHKTAVGKTHGHEYMFEAGAAIPSDGATYPYAMCTANGRLIPYVSAANNYACVKVKEPATAAGQIIAGFWMGESCKGV